MSLRLPIYLAITAIIAVLANTDLAHAKSLNGILDDLMHKQELQRDLPQFESSLSRTRRDVGSPNSDFADTPKKHNFEPGLLFRTRRQAPPPESDVPKASQQEFRFKRQLPEPPGDFQMPEM